MSSKTHPSLPVPEPLRGSEPDTFAHDTVVRRLPNIVHRTIIENEFPDPVVQKLHALIAEIPDCPMRLLEDQEAPDEEAWQGYIEPFLGLNWLEVPWFFAEFYLYRRILEATGYFQPEEWGYLRDPYILQKQMSLESSREALQPLAASVNQWVEDKARTKEVLHRVLRMDLWGNKADMSLWPASAGGRSQVNTAEAGKKQIVINDSQTVAEHLCSRESGSLRIDLLLDNAGLELVTDLYLADYLLSSGLAHNIVLHPKTYPIFVSDATAKDIEETLLFMEQPSSAEVDLVVMRLQDLRREGRLGIRMNDFWTFPLASWEMPECLRSDLGDSDLVISKGDAHYRRLLGDRHWPPTTPFAEIMSYFPSPILALRVGKSEVVCGLKLGEEKALKEQDPGWMTNGQWGWIQFKR
jgi:uncharacterized protein with ATP-grasp and redox domains